MILLYSFKGTGEFKLRGRSDPGFLQQWFCVERSYGIEMERTGRSPDCLWSAENLRRYIVEHVLLHEIGHHVQYQQRWRAGIRCRLASHIHEQFAEDYAIRFHRAKL